MANVALDLPQDLLDQLARSALGSLPEAERIRVALAVHLLGTGAISVGRAAELAGYPLVEFHSVLRELGLPTVVYDIEEYERDEAAVARLRERLSRDGGR